MERNRSENAGVLKAVSRGKSKVKTCHSVNDRPSSIIALKLIAKQGADKKAKLKQWKEVVAKLISKMAQMQKAYEEAMQAQYREMENQREFITSEIEAQKRGVREMKKTEEEDMPGP